MTGALTLSPIGKRYLDLEGTKDHYLVLRDGVEIGVIVKSVDTPDGRPWLWSITADNRKREFRKPDRGVAETREQAMVAFKAAWQNFNHTF